MLHAEASGAFGASMHERSSAFRSSNSLAFTSEKCRLRGFIRNALPSGDQWLAGNFSEVLAVDDAFEKEFDVNGNGIPYPVTEYRDELVRGEYHSYPMYGTDAQFLLD